MGIFLGICVVLLIGFLIILAITPIVLGLWDMLERKLSPMTDEELKRLIVAGAVIGLVLGYLMP